MDHPPPSWSVNLALDAFAVTVFTSLMCIFWWIFASNEVRTVARHKSGALHVLRRELDKRAQMKDAVIMLDAKITEAERGARAKATSEAASRTAHNANLMLRLAGPVVALYAGCFVGLSVHNVVMGMRGQPRPFTRGHWWGALFVFISYIPEVLFFLCVIERYNVAGNYSMMRQACGFREE